MSIKNKSKPNLVTRVLAVVIAVLLGVSFAHKLMIATLVMSVISFIHYMYDGIRQIGREEEH